MSPLAANLRKANLAWSIVMLGVLGCQRAATEVVSADTKLAMAIRGTFAAGKSTEEAEEGSSGVSPAGWANLSGRFHVKGSPRPNPLLDVKGDDMAVCAPGGATGGKSPDNGSVDVDESGGLANVLLYVSTELADEEPWTHPDAAPGKATETMIFDQKECQFLSRIFCVRAGQPVGLKNSDPVGHNTNIQGKANPAFNQIIPANTVVTWVAKKEEKQGPVPVSCSIHPWMNCHLLVRKNGYFATTKADGTFEIANLPAGIPLEFRVWHETTDFMNSIDIKGQTVKKGRFVLTLDPADPAANALDVEVDATLLK